MVTYINKNTHGKYAGNSTEEKPLTVQNGSVFFEIDTGLYYMFDAENKVWYEQKDNGGGGGSYTLPVATESTLGGIKAPAKTPDQTVPVGIGEDNKLYVAPSGEEQVQSDWAENDPQNPAYVKNRFGGYEDTTEEVIFPKQDITFEAGEFYDTMQLPEIGSNVRVNADGLDYESEVIDVSDILGLGKAIGNLLFLDGPDTGEPYFIVDFGAEDGTDWITSFGDRTISVSLSAVSKTTVKIDPKYLPTPPDPLPPITPDDESAFLQVADGKAVWNKLINRAEVGG